MTAKKITLSVLFSFFITGMWFAFFSSDKIVAAETVRQSKPALSVSTVTPQPETWHLQTVANGNVFAWQEALIGTESTGLALTEIRAHVGDRVKKGAVLALLNRDTIDAEYARINAALLESVANHAEAKANANRVRPLKESGAISLSQVEQYLTAEETAAARVASFKAQKKTVEVKITQTRIVAPDDGTISSATATLGAVVSPGMELFRLIRRDRLEWRAEIPSSEILSVRVGQAVRLRLAGKTPTDGITIQGKVRQIAPVIDQHTRNGVVYVDIEPGSAARAGMFVRGEIDAGTTRVTSIPQTALLQSDGFSYVFVLGADHRVKKAKVQIGQQQGDRVAVTAGLAANDRIVNSGVGFLADGDVVQTAPEK